MASAIKNCVLRVAYEAKKVHHDICAIFSILKNPENNYYDNRDTMPTMDGLSPLLISEEYCQVQYHTNESIIDSIFSSLLLAVPKKRRSLERRMTRRNQMAGHFEYAVPRRDIVYDEDSDSYKEQGTVCREHYQKVQEETRQMREALGETMRYTADQKEVTFLYDGENDDRPKHNGKYIVEMKKPRPSWFPKILYNRK